VMTSEWNLEVNPPGCKLSLSFFRKCWVEMKTYVRILLMLLFLSLPPNLFLASFDCNALKPPLFPRYLVSLWIQDELLIQDAIQDAAPQWQTHERNPTRQRHPHRRRINSTLTLLLLLNSSRLQRLVGLLRPFLQSRLRFLV
jgi:hypothetical protein